ncbi:hypothetical protein [Tessaracoccus flavus]|uniref:Uncharacterized protein n=1 Tax=Tessaracoccus flavus TaxID=1610493 RepID=A0A1Q2CH48_9ACTN|nr:hypothetical protein [Tessaracoccus flavus]AQP45446.1 hypothetical protein RPIT_12065 [Tessaracoccus flavus]SDY92008.1 hypothetical protein SAMN05428934_10662 [Tessaracoccus flavus]
MTQELAGQILSELERYCDQNDLDGMQPAQLKLMAMDAVKNNGLPTEAVAARIPRTYTDHALPLSMIINSALARTGTAESAASSSSSAGSAPPQSSNKPSTATRQEHSIPVALPDASEDRQFFPTHGSALPKFVSSDRTVRHEAREELSLEMMDSGFLLRWDALSAPHVIYRVTRSEGRVDFPEYSSYTAITTDASLVDVTLPDWPRLHYQVWAHGSNSTEEAPLTQPVLLAESSVVVPPQDVSIAPDQGRVVGTWRDIGVRHGRVQVYRKPLHGAPGLPTDPQFRVNSGSDNVAGFVDSDVESGKQYIYSVGVELLNDGVGEISPFIERVVEVPHKIEPVRDLEVQERRDERGGIVLDILWTPPGAGRVDIYVTNDQPEAGIDTQAYPASTLQEFKLGERLNYPVTDRVGDKVRIRDIPWYEGWSRVHFTALTSLGDRIHPSRTVTKVATQVAITEAKLHQRVRHQVVTLTWPTNTEKDGGEYTFEKVQVFRYPLGIDAEAAIQGQHLASISADHYNREGGLVVVLGSQPCNVALVPVSMQQGQQVQGRPYVLTYPGLKVVHYQIKGAKSMVAFGKTRKLSLKLRSPQHLGTLPPLVLVHNPERLPLDALDGQRVQVGVKDDAEAVAMPSIRASEVGEGWTETTWEATVPATGYVRLMADIGLDELNQFAVIDPAVVQLRLG